jgi:hypothetical protein
MTRFVSWLAFIALIFPGCQTQPPPPPAAPAKPDASVKAGALLQEYATNAVAADGKYKGKTLQVTGKFGSAQKAPLLGYSVQLLPEDAGDVETSAVLCFIGEAAKEDVGKMQPGQVVTMQGTCDGGMVGQVKLSKCTVVK